MRTEHLYLQIAGLEQNPDPEELGSNCSFFRRVLQAACTGKEPIVAMLSHSTKGSAKHADVDKVVEATKIAQGTCIRSLHLTESFSLMQQSFRKSEHPKHREAKLQDMQMYLIFPDLDAGNIGYKLVQRLGKAEAYGPSDSGNCSTGQ